ncbi:SCO family protein, partial [Vibrio sp. 1580]|nr:SCO family protein [Vibrio sp. 1580]
FYFLKPDGTLITKVPHTLTPAPIVEAISKLTTKEGSNEG